MKINKLFAFLAATFLCVSGCDGKNPDTSGFYKPDSDEEQETPDKPDKPDDGDKQDKVMTVKVMSFNIRCCNYTKPEQDGDNRWDNRKVAFAPMIADQKPDIVGMQEARPDQLDWLDKAWTKYKRVGIGRRNGNTSDPRNDEYVPIWYNSETIELESSSSWGCFWLSDTPEVYSFYEGSGSPRIATWAVFRHKASGELFFFTNTHIDINGTVEDVPVRQMKVLRAQMDKLNKKGLPLALTADFNKTLTATPYIFGPVEDYVNVRTALTGADTDYTTTYQNWGNRTGLIVDHIFCKGFTPKKYSVITKSYENVPYISDHWPIVGILEYKTQK